MRRVRAGPSRVLAENDRVHRPSLTTSCLYIPRLSYSIGSADLEVRPWCHLFMSDDNTHNVPYTLFDTLQIESAPYL